MVVNFSRYFAYLRDTQICVRQSLDRILSHGFDDGVSFHLWMLILHGFVMRLETSAAIRRLFVAYLQKWDEVGYNSPRGSVFKKPFRNSCRQCEIWMVARFSSSMLHLWITILPCVMKFLHKYRRVSVMKHPSCRSGWRSKSSLRVAVLVLL